MKTSLFTTFTDSKISGMEANNPQITTKITAEIVEGVENKSTKQLATNTRVCDQKFSKSNSPACNIANTIMVQPRSNVFAMARAAKEDAFLGETMKVANNDNCPREVKSIKKPCRTDLFPLLWLCQIKRACSSYAKYEVGTADEGEVIYSACTNGYNSPFREKSASPHRETRQKAVICSAAVNHKIR